MVSGLWLGRRSNSSVERRYRTQIILSVFLAATGFAATTQVLSHEEDPLSNATVEDLTRLYDGYGSAAQRARIEVDRLEARARSAAAQAQALNELRRQEHQQADSLAVLAGEVPVQGPGVRVTIGAVPSGSVGRDLLLSLLNELRVAGAEAMDLNGVRVVGNSFVEASDTGLLIDSRSLTSPYELTVIGSPVALLGAAQFPTGAIRQLFDQGFAVDVRAEEVLRVESVVDAESARLAAPLIARGE
ncbi:DUF881 domain-containing protein [Nocardioides sp. T5]|uniref:DUF881 domain-containing protein n=1 Tax=Nocardioides sp. T5 TaxID=3400182 RepID=UPI003A87950F